MDAISAAVLNSVRVAGSQQDLNLRPERLPPQLATNAPLYPAELCEPVYPLGFQIPHVSRYPDKWGGTA